MMEHAVKQKKKMQKKEVRGKGKDRNKWEWIKIKNGCFNLIYVKYFNLVKIKNKIKINY